MPLTFISCSKPWSTVGAKSCTLNKRLSVTLCRIIQWWGEWGERIYHTQCIAIQCILLYNFVLYVIQVTRFHLKCVPFVPSWALLTPFRTSVLNRFYFFTPSCGYWALLFLYRTLELEISLRGIWKKSCKAINNRGYRYFFIVLSQLFKSGFVFILF